MAKREIEAKHAGIDNERMMKASSLQELFDAMRTCRGDWPSDLPTFGGPDSEDTEGIWSWDATHMIVGTCGYDIETVEREDV